MGGKLLFGQEGVVQVRGAHDFLKDFMDEIELYRDARRLMDVLLGWTPRAKTMDEQFLELCVLMSKREFWSEDAFCEAWVSDLKLVGYAFPPVVEYRQPSKDVQASEKRNSATKTNDTCGDAQLGFQEWTGVHDAVAAAHPITRSTTAAPELGNTHELIERFGSQPLREADAKRAQDATDGSVLDAALGARDLDEDIRPPDDVLQMTEDDVFAQPSQIKLLVMINHAEDDQQWIRDKLRGWYLPFFHSVAFIGGTNECPTWVDGSDAAGGTMLKCLADAARAEPEPPTLSPSSDETQSSPVGFMMIPDDVYFRPWLLRLPSTSICSLISARHRAPNTVEGCPAGLYREHVKAEECPPGRTIVYILPTPRPTASHTLSNQVGI